MILQKKLTITTYAVSFSILKSFSVFKFGDNSYLSKIKDFVHLPYSSEVIQEMWDKAESLDGVLTTKKFRFNTERKSKLISIYFPKSQNTSIYKTLK